MSATDDELVHQSARSTSGTRLSSPIAMPNPRRLMLATAVASMVVGSSVSTSKLFADDDMPYNMVLFPGTHNSAINLGDGTLLRPSDAVGGEWPSEAHSSYQYIVMDQRVSVRDQLESGIRVIDLEVASLTSTDWPCSDGSNGGQVEGNASGEGQCVEKLTLHGRCFEDCPFIISHGSVEESIKASMGYTFPEAVFRSVAEFVEAHPSEVVTILMMATHGNTAPSADDMIGRLNSSGLLEYVYNYDGEAEANQAFAMDVADGRWPTLGEMRAANKTVLVASLYGLLPGAPSMTGSYVDASDITSGEADATCQADDGSEVPCLEGWDAVTFEQQSPSNAVLEAGFTASASLFAIENLSSRRGRDDHSTNYWPVPNELSDFPYQAGGNPYQASLAANYTHVIELEARWSELLSPYGMVPSWILVDFYNTTCPGISKGHSSRTLLPNPHDGLVEAVAFVNEARRKAWFLQRR